MIVSDNDISLYYCFRFSSRDLVGTVTMDLADADLLGICTKMEIERVPIPTRVSFGHRIQCYVHVIVVPWISRVYWICTTEGSSMYSPREYIELPSVT